MTPFDPPAPPVPPHPARRWAVRLTALVAAVGVAAGLASCRDPRQGAGPAATRPAAPAALPPHLFRKWPKPELALVLSGSMHGYLLPCGCSRPQVGGLERRYNFVQILRERGWPLVAVDVGDVPQKEGPVKLPNVQGLIKYRYSMRALQQTGYTAVGIGEYEASLGLFEALGEWALNNPSPRIVVANLKDAQVNFPDETRKWELATVQGTDVRVGIAGLVGPTVAQKIARKSDRLKFADSVPALKAVLREMAEKEVGLRVLLYQGSQTVPGKAGFPPEAVACAEAFPAFDVVVALSEEDEPSAEPVWVPNAAAKQKTLVAALGHKGKNIGVVGVFRSGNPARPYELRYQLVEMSEAFLTPKESRKDHPIVQMMEEYTRELKDRNYLGKYYQVNHPLQVAVKDREGKAVVPLYVGSDKCKKCHTSAYEIWQKTPHSHAYQTLVTEPYPSNRQYDAECIVCHTVGFGYRGGFTDAAKTPHLENVGCESCHGPGSEHVARPNDRRWQELMNVWRAPEEETKEVKARRLGKIDEFCQQCHDGDNDVNWIHNAFERKWKLIAHPTVAE